MINVYFHREAYSEAADLAVDPESIAASLVDAIGRGLARTGGSRLKRLRHLGTHTEKRLRTGKVRSVFSLVRGDDNPEHRLAFVHAVSRRDEAYSRDHFHARIDRFHSEVWSVETGSLRRGIADSVYEPITFQIQAAAAGGDTELEPYLTPRQYGYFRCLLPLSRTATGRDPFLTMGEGPPGSGKTLVAQEVMLRAVEEGNDVVVLVPSAALLGEYQEVLHANGMQSYSLNSTANEPQVFLYDVRKFFGDLGGDASRPGDRRERVWQWWQACQGEVAVREMVRKTVGVRSASWHRRFADLLDALYDDEIWHETRRGWQVKKDDVNEVNEDAYRLLSALRENARTRSVLESCRHSGDESRIMSRCELAERALTGLENVVLDSRPLMVIVDECQDLAPAEWRALLSWAYSRRLKATEADSRFQTRIALVGDLNQRVAVTPFTWREVARYANETLKICESLILSAQIETTSLRFAREIGLVAEGILDSRVTRRGKNRISPTANADELSLRGRVQVVVANDALDAVMEVATELSRFQGGGHQVCIVGGDEAAIRRAREDAGGDLLFSVRGVKGLEFPAVVVVHPIGMPAAPSGMLTPQQAMLTYTAATRARERLLLVLSDAEWECLARAESSWAELGITTPHTLSGDMRRALREVLPEYMLQLSSEQRVHIAVSRLRALSGGPEEEEAEWLQDILEEGRRLLRLGAVEELAEVGAAIALEWEVVARALNEVLRDPHGRNDDEARLSALIMLGEFSAAVDLVEHMTEREGVSPCDIEVLQCLELDTTWQATVRALRETGSDRFTPSHDVVRSALETELSVRIRDIRRGFSRSVETAS